MGESYYDDTGYVQQQVLEGKHREVIGGMWEEIGKLQFEFLKNNGLSPNDYLIDIGCGSLRGGLFFINYLGPNHYWGMDVSKSLLDAGYDIELAQANIQSRISRDHLFVSDCFDFSCIDKPCGYAIAQSVFTHISANRIRLCLWNPSKIMPPGGKFFATFLESESPYCETYTNPYGVTSYSIKDPFHYTRKEMERLALDMPWKPTYIGNWNHPRGQRIMIFERQND